MSKPTLLEQLSLLSNPVPTELDPEAAYTSLSASRSGGRQRGGSNASDDDDGGEGGAAAREHYVEVGPSSLRKRAQEREKLMEDDAQYGGKKSSRAEIFGDGLDEDVDDDEGEASLDAEEEDGDEGLEDEDESMEGDENDEPTEDDDDEEDEGSVDDDGADLRQPVATATAPTTETEETSAILSSIAQSRSADIAKGHGVKRQLDLFEKVMPLRIRLQKGVTALSEISTDDLQTMVEAASEAEKEALEGCLEEIRQLSEGLFQLREGLLKINEPSVVPPPSKRARLSSDDSSPAYFSAAAHDSLALSDVTHPSLVSTTAKWSSKILAAQGLSSLLPRDKFRSVRIGAVDQISASLTGSEGAAKVARFLKEGDKEFYQSLVRDVIERKGGAGGLGAATGIDTTLPNRQPKAKKTAVDTRASKGRKLRYTPHEKMMNFMVPVKLEGAGGAWHEEQVDELFSSLLGRRVVDDGADATAGEEAVMPQGLGGLRVF